MKNSTVKNPKSARYTGTRIIMIAVLFLLILVLLAPEITRRKAVFREGDIAPHDLYALSRFSMPDYNATEKLRRDAMSAVMPVYDINLEIMKTRKKILNKFFDGIESARAEKEKGAGDKPILFEEDKLKAGLNLNSTTINTILGDEEAGKLREESIRVVEAVLARGVIAEKKEELPSKLILREADKEIKKDVKGFFILSDVASFLYEEAEKVYPRPYTKNVALRNSFMDIAAAAVVPNIVADKSETLRRKEKVSQSIPLQLVWIEKDEIIVRKGEKINSDTLAKINAMEDALSKGRQPLRIIGIGLLIAIAIMVVLFYVGILEPGALSDLPELAAIGLILIVTLIIARVAIIYNFSFFIVPVAAGGMLAAILFGPETGLIVALLLSIFTGFITRFDFLYLLTGLSASVVGIYRVKDARHRSDIIKAGFLAGVAGLAVLIAWKLTNEAMPKEALMAGLGGLGNGLICAFLVAGCLPFFEYFLKITSNIKLLELSDLNHPLLKDMALKAPGSFQGSIVTGTLAEAAASSVGANALLARVGAYYHDIGKIKKPAYFTENQANFYQSKHEKLTSNISGLILISHVKDGVELARKYRLPHNIINIINEHHGTTLVFYFYHKALEEKKGETIEERDFRYPGPKPQSKEAAIVMLADSVEAASRTLTDPSPGRIENLVKKVINNKFTDYQLDECELTLKDLNKIGASFTHHLTGILHSRVQYPEEEKDANGSDRQPPEKKKD